MRTPYIQLLCLVVVILSAGCDENCVKIRYDEMMQSRTILPESLIEVCDPDLYSNKVRVKSQYSLIVFIDSTQCSTCRIKDLSRYIELMGITQGITTIDIKPIVSVNEYGFDAVNQLIHRLHFPFSVYLDSNNDFTNNNVFIPPDPRFHTFLVDENECVVFIGDPTLDGRVMELFQNYINNHHY